MSAATPRPMQKATGRRAARGLQALAALTLAVGLGGCDDSTTDAPGALGDATADAIGDATPDVIHHAMPDVMMDAIPDAITDALSDASPVEPPPDLGVGPVDARPGPDGPPLAVCAVDLDCPDGALCLDGRCLPAAACDEGAPCPDDRPCVDGRCAAVTCRDDGPCGAGRLCVQGRCADADCRSAHDCSPGDACAEGRCVPAQCRDDADCAPGTLCLDRLCLPGDCRDDAECADGARCLEFSCVVGGCRGDLDCGPEALCVDRRCVAGDCRGDGDCGLGALCVDRHCRPGECRDDAACAPGALCIDDRCVAGGCRVDADCPPERLCVAGACAVAGCRDAGDCADGLSCVRAVCVAGECLDARDCDEGALCVRSLCVFGECLDDGDCPDAAPCLDGRCVEGGCRGEGDCAAGESCLDGRCGTAGCLDDAGCPDGERCLGGACVAAGCLADIECPADALCVDARCVPGECRDDGDCPDSAPCVDQRCAVAPCRVPEDCGPGRRCVDGQCVDGQCDAPDDCRPGQICVDGACRPGDCLADAECSAGALCIERLCVEADCRDDGDCGEGIRCLRGACVAGDCLDDGDCAAQARCVERVCVEAECLADPECGLGRICAEWVCLDGDCHDDAACGDGALCIDHRCVEGGCRQHVDCAGDALCFEGRCGLAPDIARCRASLDADESGRVAGSIDGAASALVGSCGGDGPEEVWTFAIPDGGGPICVRRLDGAAPLVLHARADCASADSEVACRADLPIGGGVELDGLPGERFSVIADSNVGGAGDYALAATAGGCPRICAADAPCPGEEACVDGLCRPAPASCGAAPCPAGARCVEGACAPMPCALDADCEATAICVGGECAPDPCRHATPLPVPGRIAASTVSGLTLHPASCGYRSGPQRVFTLGAVADGPICLTTAGSSFDTVLAVRDAMCHAPDAEAACADDASALVRTSRLTLDARAGVEYFVFVEGFDGARGPFALEASAGACPEPPVCFFDADCPPESVCRSKRCVAPRPLGGCAEPTPIARFGAIEGDTRADGEAAFGAGCGAEATSNERVFVFESDAPGPVCFSTEGSLFDTVLHVRAGDCTSDSAEVACSDDAVGLVEGLASAVTVDVAPGLPYYVFVDGFGHARGAFTLDVRPGACGVACESPLDCPEGAACVDGRCAAACVDDGECGEGARCSARGCVPIPSSCEAPRWLEPLVGVHRSAVGVDTGGAGCVDAPPAPEAVFAFTVDAPTPLCLSTAGTPFDTVLSVRSDDCLGADAEVACSDDDPAARPAPHGSALSLTARPGRTYYARVDGVTPAPGEAVLEVTEGKCARTSFEGVLRDLPVGDVAAMGFERCHLSTYEGRDELAEVLAQCDGDVLLFGCRPAGDETLQVAAMGLRDRVLTEVGHQIDAVHEHNGVDWYFTDGIAYGFTTSWGFAPAGLGVVRNSCDVSDLAPESRMCWHVRRGYMQPGYRCGADVGLAEDFERLIYHRRGGL